MNNNEKYYRNKQNNGDQIQHMSLSELKPFEAQPFKVRMDESMDELVESVKEGGVLTPLVVRPHKDGGYEILSGHRRAKASYTRQVCLLYAQQANQICQRSRHIWKPFLSFYDLIS